MTVFATAQRAADRIQWFFEKFFKKLQSVRFVISILVGYCLIHFFIRLTVAPIYTFDEAEQIQFAQVLSLGYRVRHPPLVTWLTWGIIEGTGNYWEAVHALKATIMAIGFVAYFAAARRLIGVVRPAAIATLATTLFSTVGWLAHVDLTHTVVLTTMMSVSLWAALRVIQEGYWIDYIVLGVVIGLGVLSKYFFVVFAIGTLVGALTVPQYRRKLRWPRVLVALVISGLIVLPYAVWALARYEQVLAIGQSLDETQQRNPLAAFWVFAVAVGEFSLPWSIAALLFWRSAPALWRPLPEPAVAARRFLVVLMATAAVVFGALLTLGDVSQPEARWMHPILLWAPILVALACHHVQSREIVLRVYIVLILCHFCIVISFRVLLHYESEGWRCNECRNNAPFPALAEQIEQMGFDGGTVVVDTHFIGGNLRPLLGDTSRVVQVGYPLDIFPESLGDGDCLVVWRAPWGTASAVDTLPEPLSDMLTSQLAVPVAESATARPFLLSAPVLEAPARTYALHAHWYSRGVGQCR